MHGLKSIGYQQPMEIVQLNRERHGLVWCCKYSGLVRYTHKGYIWTGHVFKWPDSDPIVKMEHAGASIEDMSALST